ncbi:MAG: hypothetical protein WD716_09910 [Fimbriimonadaceae bacterium]
MKKRTKVLTGVGAGAVVLLLLACALLLQPPVPYDFLRGSTYKGTSLQNPDLNPDWPGVRFGVGQLGDLVVEEFWTDEPIEEVRARADQEFPEITQTWGPLEGSIFAFYSSENSIICQTVDDGTSITIARVPKTADRLHVWLWKLTHR